VVIREADEEAFIIIIIIIIIIGELLDVGLGPLCPDL